MKRESKDEVINRFIRLILKEAPRYDKFSMHELKRTLNLSKTDFKLYIDNSFDIRNYLVNNGYCDYYGSSTLYICLTDLGRDFFKPKKDNTFIVNNDFRNSTIGNVIQDSNLDNNQLTNNVNDEPNIKPDTKSSLNKALDSLTNNKLFVAIIILVIEEITIGAIWKFIFN